jgi:hypothetical protein
MRIIGIVVLILEPVPSDASAGGEQSQDKVLVKEAAVILGMNEPACAGVIRHTGILTLRVKLGHDKRLAGFALPCRGGFGVELPDTINID